MGVHEVCESVARVSALLGRACGGVAGARSIEADSRQSRPGSKDPPPLGGLAGRFALVRTGVAAVAGSGGTPLEVPRQGLARLAVEAGCDRLLQRTVDAVLVVQ